MAWIPCEEKLFFNPMTARLAVKMGWTINAAGGAVLRLRCWCIEFAPDGDLRPFAPGEIAVALGESPADGERLVTALIECQWLETTPYFRVSGWWQIAGLFLRGRYRREPAVWRRIERMYDSSASDGPSGEDSPSPGQGDLQGAEHLSSGGEADDRVESCTGSAHEQLMSGTRTAQEPLTPTLPHPIQAYPSKSDLNHQQLHHPPLNAGSAVKSDVTVPVGGIGYDVLARELCAHAGARRLSYTDVQELRRLAGRYGNKLIEACQYLHGGITNVPAYLRAVLEGRDDLKAFSRKVRSG